MEIKQIIKEYFDKYKININDLQIEQFSKYYELLIEWNNKFNLTAITKDTEVVEKHFVDSVMALNEFEDGSSVVDIGAGAGFPSIPLKIMNPSLKITMVDSLNKRVVFLNEVVKELKLENIIAVHSRAEDFAKKHFEEFDYATARAVANLSTLSEYTLPLIKVGGKFIALKGDIKEEFESGKNAISILGGEIVKTDKFELEYGIRTILVVNKIKNTNKKYPRDKNLPKTKPLV